MKLGEIKKVLSAKQVTGECFDDLDCSCACSSDLMSDVLAFSGKKSMLITGLNNIQVVRTAEMMDIDVVVFVRGKIPSDEMKDYASNNDIVLLTTEHKMFETSGILYSNGVGCDKE